MAFGISTLYPTTTSSDHDVTIGLSVDIVSIHGLNGDPFRTWTHPTTNKLWQRDFLPLDFPKARILNFGYDAQAASNSSTGGTTEHSRALLCELLDVREGEQSRIALIIAQQELIYANIYQSLLGVIFFGTLHQGSSLASYATRLLQIPTAITIKPNPVLLETLVRRSDVLVHLTDEYKNHLDGNAYPIVSFYETVVMKGLRTLVVEKESALLTPPGEIPTYEDQIPVSANHREMCRFASSKDKTYKATVRSIRRMLMEVKHYDIINEHFLVSSAVNTHFTGRHDIRQQLAESLIENGSTRTQKIFVLHGMGGSGKTQLCLKFANEYQSHFWAVFFLDASSIETAEQGFLKIARACKQQESIEAVKEWLSGKKHWLLIIDNADDPNLDISRFFPSGSNGTILITTRNPDFQKFASSGSCKVDEMNHEDAVALLFKSAAITDLGDRSTRKSAEDVVFQLGNFALAIIQAGAVIRQKLCSLENFCELFTKQKKELLESGNAKSSLEYQHSIFTTWEISVQRIEIMPEEHADFALKLLQVFSFMHFDSIQEDIFKKAHASQLAAEDHGSGIIGNSFFMQTMPKFWDSLLWGKAIAVLAAFSLVTVDESAQISIHPLVHEWCRDRMPKHEQRIVWEVALKTLQPSAAMVSYFSTYQQRTALLMHVNACLSPRNGDIWDEDVGLYERASSVFAFAGLYYICGHHKKLAGLLEPYLQYIQSWDPSLPHRDDEYFLCKKLFGLSLGFIGQQKASVELHEGLILELQAAGRLAQALECMVNLALQYHDLEDYQRTVDICTKVLEDSKAFAEKSNWTLSAETTICSGLLGLDKPKQALKYFQRALERSRKEFGEHHRATMHVYQRLVECYAIMGRQRKSIAIQKKCVAIVKENEGEDHPETIHALYLLLYCQIFPTKSTLLLGEEVLALHRKVFGSDHLSTWYCMEQLANHYFVLGRYSKALPLQEESYKMREEYMCLDHVSTVRIQKALNKTRKFMAARKIAHFWIPKKKDSLRP